LSQSLTAVPAAAPAPRSVRTETALGILLAISFCHFCNDMLQSLLPAIYPNLKALLGLSFGQIGLVTLAYQLTASIFQPVVGLFSDKRPTPMALPLGTLFTLAGLVVISGAHVYPLLLLGACLLGTGSAIFHPEASRVARMASGGKHGFAQSLFQVGGNAGSAIGPLAAALVVVRFGPPSLAYFALLALVAAGVLWYVARVHLAPHYLSLWLPGTLIVGLGIGLTFPVLSAAAVSSLQPERFSVGSAVNQTARQIGGALGVALLVVILGNPKNAARSLENFHHLWLFVACMALSAGVISLALRRRPSPNLIESRDTVLEAQGVEEMLDAEIAVPLRLDDVIQRPSK